MMVILSDRPASSTCPLKAFCNSYITFEFLHRGGGNPGRSVTMLKSGHETTDECLSPVQLVEKCEGKAVPDMNPSVVPLSASPEMPSSMSANLKPDIPQSAVFFGAYQSEEGSSSEYQQPQIESQRVSAYDSFKSYRSRTWSVSKGRAAESTRRYFCELEGAVPVKNRPEELTFARHLAKTKTSQLDRMDLNSMTGKSSLFISNRDEEELEDDLVGTLIRTENGARLLISIANENFLGEGRHSKVYRGALKTKGDANWKDVAVKLSYKEPDSVESLEHEISILKDVSSPYVIRIIDRFILKNNPYFELGYVTELAEFGTLDSFMQAKELFSLSLKQFISWSIQLLLAVKDLRQAGITHFDIKPKNIFVMKDYSLRLGDFGEALKDLNPDYMETRGRGTLHFTAPELLYFEKIGPCNGEAIDMYSVGTVMYYLLTGRQPWQGLQGSSTMQLLVCKKGFHSGSLNPFPTATKDYKVRLPGPGGEQLALVTLNGLVELIIALTSFDPLDRVTIEKSLETLAKII